MNRVEKIAAGIAGNVATDIDVPGNRDYDILYGQVVLDTDATVANRRVILTILDESSNVIFDVHSGVVVAASQTDQHHEFMPGIFRETSFVGNAVQVPIPRRFLVAGGLTLRISIENGVAGDSYDYGFSIDDRNQNEAL